MKTPSSSFPLQLDHLPGKIATKRGNFPVVARDFYPWIGLTKKLHAPYVPALVYGSPFPYIGVQALKDIYVSIFDRFEAAARRASILALYDHALSPTKVVDALYFAAWLRDQRRYTPKDIYPLIVALNGGMHFSPARGELPCQVYWGNPVPKMDDRYSANTLRTLDPELKSYEWPYDEVPFIEIAFQNDTPTGGNRFYYDKADGPSLTSIMADYANQNPLARNLKGEGMFRKEDFLMQLWKPYIRLAGKHPAINLGLCRLGPNDHSDAPIPYWPPDRYWQPEAYADDGPPPKVNPWRNYYNLIPVEAPQASQVPADFENFSAYKINPNPFDFL